MFNVDEMQKRAADFLVSGMKIDAIKEVRRASDCGLLNAKLYIDYRQQYGSFPTRQQFLDYARHGNHCNMDMTGVDKLFGSGNSYMHVSWTFRLVNGNNVTIEGLNENAARDLQRILDNPKSYL